MINKYFAVWSLLIPISSVVLFINVKGTLPSYFLCIISIFLSVKYHRDYDFKCLANILYVILLLTLFSQLFILIYDIRMPNLILVDKLDTVTTVFRNTLYSQGLYLLMGVITFIFVKSYYNECWDKWIIYGGEILALYGVWEIIFFLVSGQDGDFLSNRWFGAEKDNSFEGVFQQITLGGFTIKRLKSLTGEPSMYAFTMLSYWIYAIHTGWKKVALFLGVTLILSTSTTAFLGIILYLIIRSILYRITIKKLIINSILSLTIFVLLYSYIVDFYNMMVIAKLYAENQSGLERSANIVDGINYMIDCPIIVSLFGLGWGTIRSTDFFTTLLVNTGVIGFCIWSVFVLLPCFYKGKSYKCEGLKAILIIEYIVMMVGVSEFSYLFYWMFLGIAYKECRGKREIYG